MAPAETAAITVRRATNRDAQAILDCLGSAFASYEKDYTPHAYQDTVLDAERLNKRLHTMAVYVATSAAGEIVGTITCHTRSPEVSKIRGMAVKTDWQGRGVGRQLLAAVENDLRRKGCQRITLDTTKPLQKAIAFYVKNGFRESGTITDFYGMDLIEYAKDLVPAASTGA